MGIKGKFFILRFCVFFFVSIFKYIFGKRREEVNGIKERGVFFVVLNVDRIFRFFFFGRVKF